MDDKYPLRFEVEYPDRPLDRLTSALRIFTVIPIMVLVSLLGSSNAGMLFVPVLLMLLFRRRYPGWWLDWNIELLRFQNRVWVYALLMTDTYPSTEDEQSVRLEIDRPDAERDLNRWLPLVKWLLVIPHLVVLFFLWFAVMVVVIAAWFAILFTGRFPRGQFTFVEGVMRWSNRVSAYAWLLTTDVYPPFRLRP